MYRDYSTSGPDALDDSVVNFPLALHASPLELGSEDGEAPPRVIALIPTECERAADTPQAPATQQQPAKRLPSHYLDSGCHLSPSCLRCPLPMCKDDMSQSDRQRYRIQLHDARIAKFYGQCLDVEATAERFRTSHRSIYRALRRHKTRMLEMSAYEND